MVQHPAASGKCPLQRGRRGRKNAFHASQHRLLGGESETSAAGAALGPARGIRGGDCSSRRPASLGPDPLPFRPTSSSAASNQPCTIVYGHSTSQPSETVISLRLIGSIILSRTEVLMCLLISLPYEVVSNIVVHVTLEDVFNLGRTCTQLKFLITEESICKAILQAKIPYSHEALEALTGGCGNASALRRAAKRRQALAVVSPFTVATIGFGDAYLYCKGVLCYTLDDRVRILDLHRSGSYEAVISIPGLLRHAIPEIGDNSKGIFQILYYSHDVISCVYKTFGQEELTAWLIAFNSKTQTVLVAQELDSTDKIFVRHDDQYLYYGTHSEIGNDGYKKWVIQGYEFKQRTWFSQKIRLPDMVGSDIGSTVCFEFHDNYFYALSNQTSFEVEEIDWTSFYHCTRFPLGSPCKELLEKTENKDMWRRQHQEGPIDDRWTSIRLETDEQTGEVKIIESRKEWYLGSSRSQRTYYTTAVVFPKPWQEDLESNYLGALSSLASAATYAASSASSSTVSLASSSSTSTAGKIHSHDLSTLPDDPILRLLGEDDNPHHIQAPARLPQNTHPGNDGSSLPSFTLAKSRVRHYYSSASTFLDLVDDPLPTDWQSVQRLRLRAGCRSLGPPLFYDNANHDHPKQGLLRKPSPDLSTALQEMYRESPIRFWPAAQDPDPDHSDDNLDALYKLLNPPTHLGNVQGTADDRSLIYVTGGFDKPQAIIFISFDPAIKLEGLEPWQPLWRNDKVDVVSYADEWGNNESAAVGKPYVDVEEHGRTVSIERKGKGKERVPNLIPVQVAGGQALVDVGHSITHSATATTTARGTQSCWAWQEKAMYRDIGLGFYFGS